MTSDQKFRLYVNISITTIVLLGLWFCWLAFQTLRIMVGFILHMFLVPAIIVVAAGVVIWLVRKFR